MSLSLKRLALSLTLLAIGGGAGLLGSRYFPAEKGRFAANNGASGGAPVSGRAFPSGETGGTRATTAISLRQWWSRTGGSAN